MQIFFLYFLSLPGSKKFLKLYCIDYNYSCPNISPSIQTPDSLRQSPHHCSCPWVMWISSLATPFPIRHCVSPWLFCNYLFVLLNHLISSPIPPQPTPSGNHQKARHIHNSVSVLFLCFGFKDSVVERYIFLPVHCS